VNTETGFAYNVSAICDCGEDEIAKLKIKQKGARFAVPFVIGTHRREHHDLQLMVLQKHRQID
jgi:hypothetical protein